MVTTKTKRKDGPEPFGGKGDHDGNGAPGGMKGAVSRADPIDAKALFPTLVSEAMADKEHGVTLSASLEQDGKLYLEFSNRAVIIADLDKIAGSEAQLKSYAAQCVAKPKTGQLRPVLTIKD